MLALFSPVFARRSSLLSDSNCSLSFAAVLFVVILNTPMLFVASGKPSGTPSAVVVFLLAEILIFDRSIQTYIRLRTVVHVLSQGGTRSNSPQLKLKPLLVESVRF